MLWAHIHSPAFTIFFKCKSSFSCKIRPRDQVDITRHTDQQLNAIPNDLQARVKIRWDDGTIQSALVASHSLI